MKSEWKSYPLEKVCLRIYSGGTPSTRQPEYWNGDIRWLSSGETSQRFIYDTERKITLAGVNNSSTKLAKKGSTVVATAGQGYTRGQASFLMVDTYMNQSVIACEANTDFILPLYLYYNLDSRYEEFRLLSDGTSTRGGLSGWILKRMEIQIPSLEEQTKIVGILEVIDRKIEVNNKVNQNLYEQMTAYYKHLFSELTTTTKAGELAENIFSGGTPSTSHEDYWNGPHYWLSSGETSNRFILSTQKTITDEGVNNSSTRKAQQYDIVIASAGQGHTRGQTSMLLTDSYVNQSIIVVHAEPEYLPFLFWNITNRYEELRVISNSNSIRGSLTTKMINSLEVPAADKESITKFSDYAWPIIYSIENNLKENHRLTIMRDALLPRLMSGELDVSELEL